MIITPWLRHAVLSTLMGIWYGLCPNVLMNITLWISVGGDLQTFFIIPYVYINTCIAICIYYFFAPYLYWQFAQDEFRNPLFQWKIGIGNYLLLNVGYAYSIFIFTEVTAMTIGVYSENILHRSMLVVVSSSFITTVLYLMGEFTENE